MRFLKRLICKIRGHKYRTDTFTSNVLYFCDRCGEEMFGRTSADLEPMTQEERDSFLNDEWCYSEE